MSGLSWFEQSNPEDDFLLPHIDVLKDNKIGHALFSFMDELSGYNQTRMASKNCAKTCFITPWDIFFYKVMSFGLKSASATYQRAMIALFHDMMNKAEEVYVDDMITKSKTTLQIYKRCLNDWENMISSSSPTMCIWCNLKQIIGLYCEHQRGIEVDRKNQGHYQNASPRRKKRSGVFSTA